MMTKKSNSTKMKPAPIRQFDIASGKLVPRKRAASGAVLPLAMEIAQDTDSKLAPALAGD